MNISVKLLIVDQEAEMKDINKEISNLVIKPNQIQKKRKTF